MWQDLVVWIIVLVAAYYVVRQVARVIGARRGCQVDTCKACPFEEGCDDPEKRRGGGKGGGGCGCGGE